MFIAREETGSMRSGVKVARASISTSGSAILGVEVLRSRDTLCEVSSDVRRSSLRMLMVDAVRETLLAPCDEAVRSVLVTELR